MAIPTTMMNGRLDRATSPGWAPPDTAQNRLALDNLLRRELRVSDPTDAKQIAEALMARYSASPRARAIAQEAAGLPFLQAPAPAPTLRPQDGGATGSELQQAMDDVERDVEELTTNTLLKDITPEIRGWAQAIRTAIREGTSAARFGLDPRQRDKAMSMRRTLCDYARLARYVGALTPNATSQYRTFAKSLDEAAAIILVLIGESLANQGFNGGNFLLQVPYAELQVRRDAAIHALRNLTGATQLAFGPNEWPRGLDAYRRLFDRLEAQGQGDLRSLLVENELARTMDELIQRAAHGMPEGLRAVGATAQLDLERFRRLIALGRFAAVPESPPLAGFLEALQLFVDGFTSAGGFRLVRIARPAILTYGLYGQGGGLGVAEQRLLDLVIRRNRLAELLDCYGGCDCTAGRRLCQVLLDALLASFDRAIDLYAIGTQDFGEPERRAAAYAFVLDALEKRDQDAAAANADACVPMPWPAPGAGAADPVARLLADLRNVLRPDIPTADPTNLVIMRELGAHALEVRDWLKAKGETVLRALIEASMPVLPDPPQPIPPAVTLARLAAVYAPAAAGAVWLRERNVVVTPPDSVDAFFEPLTQELCVQRHAEERWQALVTTLAPSCIREDRVLLAAEQLIATAMERVGGGCVEQVITIPPDPATSLDALANGITATGLGR